jgi:hypothetical protein
VARSAVLAIVFSIREQLREVLNQPVLKSDNSQLGFIGIAGIGGTGSPWGWGLEQGKSLLRPQVAGDGLSAGWMKRSSPSQSFTRTVIAVASLSRLSH